MRLLVLILGSLIPLTAGCGGEGEDPPVGPADVVVGSALVDGTGFVDVVDGQDVELVGGAQGGFHVWLNLRVQGYTGTVFLERTAQRVSDGQQILNGNPTALEVPESAMLDWWTPVNATPSFMCPSPLGVNLVDEEIHFDVRLVTEDGAVIGSDEITVKPQCPAADGAQRDLCFEICTG